MATIHIERHSLADLHADPPRPVEYLDVEAPDTPEPVPEPPPATLSDPPVSDPTPKRPVARPRRLAPKGEDDAD